MNKSLWIITELYYPETTSTGYILTQLAEGLSCFFTVNAICGQPSYAARGTRAQTCEQHNGVNIQRCWGTTFNKDVLPLRMFNLVTITLTLFFATLRNVRRGDLVLVVTNPPVLPLAVAIACWIRGAKCSLIIHDVYPELAIAAGKLTETSAFAKLLRWLNVRLYHRMEYIFVLGRDMQARIADMLTKRKERVIVATNWADLSLIVPGVRSENTLLHELNLTDKFVVQYAGNMGYPNDIESIAQAAMLLQQEQDIHFVFIGSGAKKRQIELTVEKNGLSNVTILNQRPRSDQPVFLNACDVALIALVAGMRGVSVPSRTYNTLAAAKPIIAICEEGSELELVIQEDGVGWAVTPGQPDQLALAILEAKSQPELLKEMGSRSRHTAESKYSFDAVLHIFQQTLSNIT